MMNTRNPFRRRTRAFSLIELLLVLVILAVLAVVVVPRVVGRSKEAKNTAALTAIKSNLGTALDMFAADNDRYPSSEEGLQALITPPPGLQDWKGPYLKDQQTVPTDPWGNPYIYRYPGSNNPGGYDLYSLGPDGREGGDDISNLSTK
jgi:general secretion pathway protein G